MDWCSHFGFEFDPFFDKPLESKSEMEKWLVIEKKMDEQIDPLIRQMSHIPFLSLVIGERGVGKSTFMYYSMSLAAKTSNILPVYVGLDHIGLEISPRPTFSIAETLLYQFGVKLLEATLKQSSNFFVDNKSMLLSLAHYLGLAYQESDGFLPSGKPYRIDFFELKRYLLAVLNLLKIAKIPVFLSIDNLDKVSKMEILESFFTAAFSQTFFDELKKGGVSILISMAPPFAKIKERNSSLKYISQTIVLQALSPPQSVELLAKRIQYSNDPPPRNPFSNEAIASVCVKTKGITRDILTEARNLCIKAYEERLPEIRKEFVDAGLVSFNETRTFYEILDQSPKLRSSLLRLSNLASSPDVQGDQIVTALRAIIAGREVKISGELLNILLDSQIVRSGSRDKFILDESMTEVMEAVKKSSWNMDSFLSWIFAKDSIKILAEGIPGLNAKSSIDKFGPVPGLSKTYIKVVVADTEETIQARTFYEDAVAELQDARTIMNNIGRLTWDDIDNMDIYKQITAAVTSFLTAFSKLYICCATSRVIRLKSLKPSDLIENAVHHFQEEFGLSFKSFHRFLRIRANINGIIRGGFSPNHSDIRSAFDDFAEIVSEFTGYWQSISTKFLALEQADDRHEPTLRDLSKIALLMGYSIERPEYKRFKIDGEKYYKMKLLPFPFDEGSVDLVREKRIQDRLGQTSSHFFICSIKPDSRTRARPTEAISFIQKCNDLISKIDSETTVVSQGFSKYLLVYVSIAGFDKGIWAAVQSTARAQTSEIRLLDYREVANLRRQLTPSKKIPAERISEGELTKFWTTDLEELLRLRACIGEVIHRKFEKSTTVLLADMKDFTKRTMKDTIQSAEAVQKMSDVLEQNVKIYDGVGFNTEGDSFIATFDKPELAALAALKSIEKLEVHNQQVKEDEQIYIRIGMCTGEVLFKNDRPFIGNAVNIAARIMKEAEPNKVVTTEETYKQISALRNFEFKNLGRKELKNVEKPVVMYEIHPRKTQESTI